MANYYNEFDPYAADWLRSLIANGQIPAGDIDERSIKEVQPDDLRGYTQCHFFAGIGGWSYALRLAGWSEDRPVWSGSPPCQPFSSAGKRKGKQDDRHLWPEFYRLIRECRPPVVFGEQVSSKDGLAWFDDVQADMQMAGYACAAQDICGASIGAPHIRQRLWIVAQRLDRTTERRDIGQHIGRQVQQCLDRGETGGMANSDGERHENVQRGVTGEILPDGHSGRAFTGLERGESDSRVADSRGKRRQQIAGGASGHEDAHRGARRDERESHGDYQSSGDVADGRPAPTNGFWANPDWLLCRDGKWRPVKSSLKPLVAGLPGDMGRLCPGEAPTRQGMLKGYGNAIVPWVAKGIIEDYLDYERYLSLL